MIQSSVCLLHKRLICPALPQTARPARSYTTSWDTISTANMSLVVVA